MESILHIVTSFVLALSGAGGAVSDGAVAVAPSSSEIGIAELSPAGEAGGYAMPASGCSTSDWHGQGLHDCACVPSLSLETSVIRAGDTTTLSWTNGCGVDSCVLSGSNLAQPVTSAALSSAGSVEISPLAGATYSVICGGDAQFSESISIRVLPRVQET